MRYDAGSCDVAVVGAGHAGIEAALAAARLGLDTVCFTINMDAIGNMPCNPAIGGTGKGHLVRELDALGGEMARAADQACIQYRMLNRGKGPAVHSLRAQADRRKYQAVMKHTLELQANLRVKQAEVVAVETEDGHVSAVVTANGAVYRCRAAVLATGTYLHGRTIVGDVLRWYANELGYGDEADFWQAVGILHDLDFEQWPEQHCTKEQELLRERGIDERLIHAVASHGYALTVNIAPEHEMEKVLYAADELTGLIGAVALMRPSKSVSDMEVKSVRKKYKDRKFAAGCSREVIERGAAMLGWELNTLIEKTILAMRASDAVD